MRKAWGMVAFGLVLAGVADGVSGVAAPAETNVIAAVETYFDGLFDRLERVAEQQPTEATFRALMKPEIEKLGGFYGASFINPDWEIRAVHSRRHALAVGYSLTKVKQLDAFRKKMAEKPAPQLSEPSDGGLMRPSLITMRQPVMKDGSAPSEARRFLRGASPRRVRTSHPLVPSVGTMEEESNPNEVLESGEFSGDSWGDARAHSGPRGLPVVHGRSA